MRYIALGLLVVFIFFAVFLILHDDYLTDLHIKNKTKRKTADSNPEADTSELGDRHD